MRLAVWSPAPPAPSGIADYVAEQLAGLERHFDVTLISEEPPAGETAPTDGHDLDVYHLGNSPAHGFVYRAALRRPGVVVLHDWSLHHLVLQETVEQGDVRTYLREMRRAYGDKGTFLGRQIARALGGELLPALYPLNDRVLESSLGVVGLTEYVRSRAARRLPGRPVLHLPHHLSLPIDPVPSRDQARRALGLPEDALLVTSPGLATASKRLDVAVRAVGRLRQQHPALRLVVAGGRDPRLALEDWARQAGLGEALILTGRLALEDFVRHLAAADVILSLRFPSHGEISGALVRALGVGRPALVTAGTPAALEFPEGVVLPVDPGPSELDELVALLQELLADAPLRSQLGCLARDHVTRHHALDETVARLAGFLREVHAGKPAMLRSLGSERIDEGSLLGYLTEEVRWGARELGLPGLQLGLGTLLEELVGGAG